MSYVTKEQAMLTDIILRLNNLEKKIGKHIHIITRGLESTRLRQEKLETLLDKIDRFMVGSEMTMSELLDRTEHIKKPSYDAIMKMDESKKRLEITTQEAKENPTLEEFVTKDLDKKFWPEDQPQPPQQEKQQQQQQQPSSKPDELVISRDAYQRIIVYRANVEKFVTFNHISFKPSRLWDYTDALDWKLTIRLNELRDVHKRPVRKNDKRPRFRKFEVYLDLDEVNALREILKKTLEDKTVEEVGLYLKMRSAGYIKKDDIEIGKPVYINRIIRFKRKDLRFLRNKVWEVISQSKSIKFIDNAKVVVK